MNKGMALITVFIIAFLLFAIVGAFLYLVTNARSLNARYDENLISLGLAEAGVDFAIWEINFGGEDFSSADGWGGTNPKTISISNFQDADGNIYGDIDVWVYDPGTDNVTVISKGTLPSSITGPVISRAIKVKLHRHRLFRYAILAGQIIDVGGTANKIDSYDSSLGSYGGTNVGQNGDIVTNCQETPSITLRGGATVDGDAITGPGGTVSISGSASLSGVPDDDADVFMPAVVVPPSLTSLTSQGPISLSSSNSLELTTGNYKYDYIDLSAQSKLTLNGDVNLYLIQNPSITTSAQSQIIVKNGKANIYFDGNASLSGQGVSNQGGTPSDLTFYGTESVTNINVAGIGQFCGTFYAPQANYFDIAGNSEIFGAVVGSNVTLTGTATIHYDENLHEIGPTIGYDPYAWQEK